MLSWPGSVRIFVATDTLDMRCGFDRLAYHVQAILNQDPLSGHLFVFFNRVRNRCKILFWDQTGYCLWYKRLEAGTFETIDPADGSRCRMLDRAGLTLLLEGIDLGTVRHRKRYHRPGEVPG
jgi:transposase